MKQANVTIYNIALDLSSPNAATVLFDKLEVLSLSPVFGVMHAVGVLDDQLMLKTIFDLFNRILAFKIVDTFVLHQIFSPISINFFVLFFFCEQLFGFLDQTFYVNDNAFLNNMVEHRRVLDDNAIALQWISWRGLSIAAFTSKIEKFIETKLQNKNIINISRDNAFRV